LRELTNVQPAHRGMSAFVIEKGESGMVVGRDIEKLGYKGVETGEPHFADFPVPAENLSAALKVRVSSRL
jgi:alkylation response protein AidB-like acyl-CoA dehydrogenase